jgi:hypothetical protein
MNDNGFGRNSIFQFILTEAILSYILSNLQSNLAYSSFNEVFCLYSVKMERLRGHQSSAHVNGRE